MADSLREDNSPRESIEIDRKSYSTVRTVRTVHSNIERRRPIEVRMRKSNHEAFMEYCHITKRTAGQFYEEAGILFMDIYPPPMAKVHNIIVPDREEQSLDDQIDEVILIDELYEAVRTLSPERKVHINKKKKLAKLLKRGRKLNQRGDRLEELMLEAVGYLV